MREFSLNGNPFIELNKLLKLLRLVNSGGEANILIQQGDVLVNNEVEHRKRKKLVSGDTVQVFENKILIQE